MRTALLLLALAVAGCDSGAESASSDLAVTDQTTLRLNETTVVGGVSVTFQSVEEDSRCPPDHMCVWEGVAFVSLDLDGATHDVRVADPEHYPEAGVRVGDVTVFASDLSFDEPTRVTVVTTE